MSEPGEKRDDSYVHILHSLKWLCFAAFEPSSLELKHPQHPEIALLQGNNLTETGDCPVVVGNVIGQVLPVGR